MKIKHNNNRELWVTIRLAMLFAFLCFLISSCERENDLAAIEYRVVRVINPDPKPWDAFPDQLITLEQLATQNWNSDIYDFELRFGCRAQVIARDGSTKFVVDDLDRIADQEFPIEQYEFKPINCN
jgi:hypothetical protein